MKSWVAAPSLFSAGSRVDHAPAYPLLSRTVIEPPDVTGATDPVTPVDGDVVGLVVPDDEAELLHAAAARTSAAAPARQADRFDISRNLTAFTYS
jgi:hypothetical protein